MAHTKQKIPSESSTLGTLAKSQATSDSLAHKRRLYALQDKARGFLPHERVYHCGRTHTNHAGNLTVMQNQNGSVHMHGLQQCGSVWHCPVCAAKISERRKVELQEAIEKWCSQGGKVTMITYTIPHGAVNELKPLVQSLTKSRSSMLGYGNCTTAVTVMGCSSFCACFGSYLRNRERFSPSYT